MTEQGSHGATEWSRKEHLEKVPGIKCDSRGKGWEEAATVRITG